MSKLKLVITGAAGLVGLNLLHLIDHNRYQITAIDKHPKNCALLQKLFPQVRLHCLDLADSAQAWHEHLNGADALIALQAQISAPAYEPYKRNNIDATENVLQACSKHNVAHLIHISSSVVISVAKDHYTNSKKAGEDLVLESSIPYTVLRPPLMYGCFDHKHIGFLVDVLEKLPVCPIPGHGQYMRQPLYVEDLCQVILSALRKKPSQKVHNIIGKQRIWFKDMLKSQAQIRGLKPLFFSIPLDLISQSLKLMEGMHLNPPFISDQLDALTAGDDFPLEDWEQDFQVSYTEYATGLQKMINHPLWTKHRLYTRNTL